MELGQDVIQWFFNITSLLHVRLFSSGGVVEYYTTG